MNLNELPSSLQDNAPPDFYSNAEAYWSGRDASIRSMLGGFCQVDIPDIQASSLFLDRFGPKRCDRAIDCGAGIGRVTKRLLLPRFATVDMVEVTKKFIDQSENYIGMPNFSRVGHQFCESLQTFTPEVGAYDLIWIQWVIGHLTVPATISFFRRCSAGLRQPVGETSRRSVIILKDNVSSTGETIFDEDDSSYLRSHDELLAIFKLAGLRLIADELQTNLPVGLYPVRAFAMLPVE